MINRSLRLTNLLIDSAVYLVFVFVITLIVKSMISRENLYWILIGVYYCYYLILETITGQTIGKYFTKTKVVSNDETKSSFGKILIRTILRMIPFDCFSYLAFSQGIHDKYSQTKLIKS